MSDLQWPAVKMAKLMDVTPSRLRQLVAEGVVQRVGRDRYRPFECNVAYIRFLRDRMKAPDGSDSEFHAAKLAKLRSEKECIDLDMEIKRGLRIPIDTVKEVVGRAFMSVAATIKANRDKVLTEAQINEMFAMLRDSGEKLISKNGGQHI
jgi:hypothetical protein